MLRRADAWHFIEDEAPVRLDTLEKDVCELKGFAASNREDIAAIKTTLGDMRSEFATFRDEQTPNGRNTRNVGDLTYLIAEKLGVLPAMPDGN